MSDRELFIAALEQDDHDRQGWLDQACQGDQDRRRRLDVLLRAHELASQFLASPGGDQTRPAGPAKTDQPDAPPDLLSLLAPAEKPGQLGKLGHYEILEVVGQGGMGVVVKAYDPKLHRVVAIKLLAPHLAANPSARQRFEREARAVAAVRNEHVVAIHDVETSGPAPYLVMEFIGGASLQDRLDKRGRLEVKEILRIGIQAARGLAAAHEQGLVHRDVKPANILLENGVERVKITDFGLARAVDDASLTQSGVIAGTPLFMSPEQADGKPFDPRSDLFSLGGVLYALCTGHAPFRASGTMAVLKRVTEDTPRPIRESNPDVPDWLEAIVAKLLAKKPEGRFQTADALAELLGQYLAHIQQPNQVALPAPVRVDAAAHDRPEALALPPARWRKAGTAVTTLAIALTLILALNRAGLITFAGIAERLFYHRVVLRTEDRGVVVRVWRTKDKVERPNSFSFSLEGPDFSEPFRTTVLTGEKTLRLPRGNYWLFADKGDKRVLSQLLRVDWGGVRWITIHPEQPKPKADNPPPGRK
jgi:tRNA A-37 threonylcarbamoyl transferase component Bud32